MDENPPPPVKMDQGEIVYLSVRLCPKLQHLSPSRDLSDVPAHSNVTWQEFFKTVDLDLNPNDHYLSGPSGVRTEVSSVIKDWISKYPFKVTIFPLTVEVNPAPTQPPTPPAETKSVVPAGVFFTSTLDNNDLVNNLEQENCNMSLIERMQAGDENKDDNKDRVQKELKKEHGKNMKELPDMVPVSVRHSLPEFQHVSIQSVLAGLLLTWDEFFKLCDVKLDPDTYLIKGSNGTRIYLHDQIGTYVGTYKRKQKMYTITLSRLHEPVEGQVAQNSVSSTINQNQPKAGTGEKDTTMTQRYSSKRMKLLDVTKEDKQATDGTEKFAQKSDQDFSIMKRGHGLKRELKRTSTVSTSETPVDGSEMCDAGSGTNVSSDDKGPSFAKRKRHSLESGQSLQKVAAKVVRKRGRKPKPRDELAARRITSSSRKSRSTRETTDSSMVGSSDDEEECTREKRKRLKRAVMKYLWEKVSPRSFLRIRSELMNLREREKYFKITSLVPLTAGMMEQTFCRKVETESNPAIDNRNTSMEIVRRAN